MILVHAAQVTETKVELSQSFVLCKQHGDFVNLKTLVLLEQPTTYVKLKGTSDLCYSVRLVAFLRFCDVWLLNDHRHYRSWLRDEDLCVRTEAY